MAAQESPRPNRAQAWLTAGLIVALVLFCQWPALRGGLLWDDSGHLTKPELQSFGGLRRIWFEPGATQQYYPALHTAFWIEHRVWGDSTLGYHLLNALLHAASAGLLILILRRLRVQGALLAGLIFAVHPVCVESVAWISEQKNTLSLVFYLLAALAYLHFDETRTRRPYWLASGLFVLAILSKSVTATLPAALLVVIWWKRGTLRARRDALPLVPWFAAAAVVGAFTAWMEQNYIGARGADFSLTVVKRTLLAGRVIWFYLGKLVWPTNLSFIYPHWDVRTQAHSWLGYLLATLGVTIALWCLRKRRRGPLAAWLFFVGSLFPALGFFDVYPFVFSYVADHFQYLACLGIIAAAAAGFTSLLARIKAPSPAVGPFLCALPIAALALMAQHQSRMYTDVRTLYRATTASNPDCWMAHYNLGLLLAQDGRSAEAMDHFRSAARSKADFAAAHDDLANALAKMPDGQTEAIAEYGAALRLKPDFAEAHNNLANVLAEVPGHLPEAIEHYQAALRLKPDFAEAHNNLAFQLAKLPGRTSEAIAEYEVAVRLKPDYFTARYNLANLLVTVPDRLSEAIAQFEAILRATPGTPEIMNNLAVAYANAGRMDDAIAQEEAALRLDPRFAPSQRNLAHLKSMRGY